MNVLRVALQRSVVAFAAPSGGTMTRSLLSSSGKQYMISRVQTAFSERSNRPVRRMNIAQPKSKSFMERLLSPAGNMSDSTLPSASVLADRALSNYGLGFSNEVGTTNKDALWSEIVRTRIQDTYKYFGGSIVVTAASALAVGSSPHMVDLLMNNFWVTLVGSMAAGIGTLCLCMALPYKEEYGAKQLALLSFNVTNGVVLAPLTILGGPLVIQAALCTAAVVGGLSMVAVCAPSEKFLYMGGPLSMGLGVVLVSSFGALFFPGFTAFHFVSLYGGMALFSAYMLYDTQKIIYNAKNHPINSTEPYDPINNSIGIYLNTINIFIRILEMLAKAQKSISGQQND